MTASGSDSGVSDVALETAASWLRDASRVVVMTGAGVSAESGIKTFRDADGLWRTHDPMSLGTPEAFAADPSNVWAFYRWRQSVARQAEPNAGHFALAKMEGCFDAFVIITQNVDGLHERAGSTSLISLHGDLYADRCTRCGQVENVLHAALPSVNPDAPETDPPLPLCAACNSLMRPGVVWFGEPLPDGIVDLAGGAAIEADVMLIVGTSGVVYPAAGFAKVTRRGGGRVIVLNPADTPHSSTADLHLRGTSAVVLPKLLAVL